MDLLHTLHQNPEASFSQLLGERMSEPGVAAGEQKDELDDFLAEFEL
jgi:hypothetical protein